MKSQLVLLSLVVLFVSLSSVVFSRPPPVRTLPSGETSEAAPKVETVKKSWEGPLFGLGAGLGLGFGEASVLGESASSGTGSLVDVKIRLGYGISDRTVLYGSVFRLRFTDVESWSPTLGLFGAMWKWRGRNSYGFAALGTSFSSDSDSVSTFVLRTGNGLELYPGLALEGAYTGIAISGEGASFTIHTFGLTFNYHWY